MFETRRLRLLLELAQRGTVTAVADAAAMTPSAVSQQLAQLQREAGVALYVREGRLLRITDAGWLLVRHTERLLTGLEEAHSELAELAGSVTGPVRLSAFPTVARALVPDAVARCRRAHPRLRIVLDEREAPESLAALRGHDTDLALVYAYELLPPHDTRGIALTRLLTEAFVVLLPPDRDPPEGALALDSLADETWISAYGDTAGRAALDRACAQAGFTPRVDYASNDYTVIIALVRAGLGVALVPRLALEPGDSDIVVRPLEGDPVTRVISLAARPGTGRHPALRALSADLVATAREWRV
ncbi:DNA-binding transcriptional LysR family regulator [Spinactinospora alkalitolerans]|uniref:DNA-binding transcriptional LysR family regulator n=1 Tax=Spinactinospora alkalitolerans TaxID=687207 RepID=A0A852TT29_9ACTN|nr:LysR family transcriptional regulator [Spinactinospora alkalitolerans]NYE45110.1 DNA-binding transcriptional LysR family regulator [Spinactinospora alkalitolerans]